MSRYSGQSHVRVQARDGAPIHVGAVLLFMCLLPISATAGETKVGATTLKLPAPPGYCELDAVKASDARLVTATTGMLGRTGSRLLALSADCGELGAWRAGKRSSLDHVAQYQTLLGFETNELPSAPEEAIKNACHHMRAQGEAKTPELKERAAQAAKTIQVNETKFVGVVAEDLLVCYAALLQKFRTESGLEKIRATLLVTMAIKGKVIYSFLFAPYDDGDTLIQMLAAQRVNVARLQAANRHR
jgi:hypothetical protein